MLSNAIKITSRLSIPLFVLMLAACSEGLQGDKYFPIQEGLSWNYSVSTTYDNETSKHYLSIESLGKESVDNKSYYVRRTSSGIDYYLNADDSGVYREGLRTRVELKPRLDRSKRYVLKYPLQEGSNWNEISRPIILMRLHPYVQRAGDAGVVPMSYQIESTNDTVKVPAGEYKDCIKVVGSGVFEIYTDGVNGYSEIPIKVEEWYAPGVGLVKQVRYEMDGESIKIADTPVFMGGRTELVLTSFVN